jgi:hypothetical protein
MLVYEFIHMDRLSIFSFLTSHVTADDGARPFENWHNEGERGDDDEVNSTTNPGSER